MFQFLKTIEVFANGILCFVGMSQGDFFSVGFLLTVLSKKGGMEIS